MYGARTDFIFGIGRQYCSKSRFTAIRYSQLPYYNCSQRGIFVLTCRENTLKPTETTTNWVATRYSFLKLSIHSYYPVFIIRAMCLSFGDKLLGISSDRSEWVEMLVTEDVLYSSKNWSPVINPADNFQGN